ncbi:MAG: DUF4199 domain-containing protein [Bacteroidota bacterium]
MNNKPTTPAVKGLIISAILVVYSIVIISLKMDTNKDLGPIPYAIVFGGTLFGSLYFAREMNGNVSFMEVFKHGFKMTTLVAAIAGFWILISMKYLFPHVLEHGMELIKTNMVKQGKTHEEADKFIAGYRNGALAMSSIMTVVLYIIIGALGAVTGAVFSTKNPEYIPGEQAK